MSKSTDTWYYEKGQKTHTVFNSNTGKEMTGDVIKEKKGYLWVDFGNKNVRRIKKF